MTSRELLHCLRSLVGVNVVGADIVEVAPAYDHAEITGIAAAHVAYELLSVLAGKRMTDAPQRRRGRRGNPCRARCRHPLRHPRHPQPRAVPALPAPRDPADHAAPRAGRGLCRRGVRQGQRTPRGGGHHQRARPDQRDDGGRHRVRRIPTCAAGVVGHAHRRRGPRPGSAARSQERQRRDGPDRRMEPPGGSAGRSRVGRDRGLQRVHRTAPAAGAHRDPGRRAGAAVDRRAADRRGHRPRRRRPRRGAPRGRTPAQAPTGR